MHALVILTAVLSTLAAEPAPAPAQPPAAAPTADLPEVSTPARPEVAPSPPAGIPTNSLQVEEAQRAQYAAERATVGRISLESLAGLGFGVGSLGVYGLARNGSVAPTGPETVLFPLGLLALGSSLGVTLVGGAMHRQGNFGFTLLGSVVGVALPIAIGAAAVSAGACDRIALDRCDAVQVMAVAMLVLPTLGAVIGFESSEPDAPAAPSLPSKQQLSRRQLVPVLAPTRQGLGATIGVAGTL